ncbi:MAG: hypothetical protein K0U93_19380, partial [Gammaproteobacteria bacterium]|nr:hypothetical protein [Gammaproteobacteria bacterium]
DLSKCQWCGFAQGIAAIDGIDIDLAGVQTNIVYFSLADRDASAAEFCATLAQRGLVIGAMSPTRLRAVTHLDVSKADIDRAVELIAQSVAA